MPRGCPRVEPCSERARFPERELMVLKSRREERVSFEGAGRNARQSWVPERGPAHLDLDYVFGAAWVLQPRVEPPRRSRKARVKGSDGNDETKKKIFDRDTPCLDIRTSMPHSGHAINKERGRPRAVVCLLSRQMAMCHGSNCHWCLDSLRVRPD